MLGAPLGHMVRIRSVDIHLPRGVAPGMLGAPLGHMVRIRSVDIHLPRGVAPGMLGAPLGHMVRIRSVDIHLPRGVAPGYHIAHLWCAVAEGIVGRIPFRVDLGFAIL
jgi:hypothetical protein